MKLRWPLRWASRLYGFVLIVMLHACAAVSPVPHTPPPLDGGIYPGTLSVDEPAAQEVVIVINDNLKMKHSGMFVGAKLVDPAGSYKNTRELRMGWRGVSLEDYVRYQLEDGPDVKLYRFELAAEPFARILARADVAGRTMPLFCVAKVQNLISGIGPFEAIADAWLVFPSTLAGDLDRIVMSRSVPGVCNWPNGASCYPAENSAGNADSGGASTAVVR